MFMYRSKLASKLSTCHSGIASWFLVAYAIAKLINELQVTQ